MLPLEYSTDGHVPGKLPFPSRLRLDESLRLELQLIAPIVGVWIAVFLVSICLTATRAWRAGFELFLLTHCGVGVFMTAIWISFYGSMSWKRIVAGISLVAATAVLGVCIRICLGGPANSRIWISVWVPIFVMLATLILTTAARQCCGWRILHLRHVTDVVEQKRFSIRDVFIWTTFVAAALTLLRFILALEGDNFADAGWRIFVPLIFGVLVPSIATIVLLGLASRVRIYWLVLAVPVLAACIAILISGLGLLLEDGGIDFVIRRAFWPTLKWCTAAGFALVAAIWHLRKRGVVFAFGAGNEPESLERAKRHYESSLRRKIAALQAELEAAGG